MLPAANSIYSPHFAVWHVKKSVLEAGDTGVITTSLYTNVFKILSSIWVACSSTGSVIAKNSLLLQLDVK